MNYFVALKYYLILLIISCVSAFAVAKDAGNISIENSRGRHEAGILYISGDIILDNLKIGTNHQIYITPVITDDKDNIEKLPSVLVNGHAMQIAFERHILTDHGIKVSQAVERKNGKPQIISYSTSLPFESWMTQQSAKVEWIVDKCGCGTDPNKNKDGENNGSYICYESGLGLNPAQYMLTAFITPPVTALPVRNYEGEAYVQYELSRSELHTEPYECRNGQKIDNRDQLRIIHDSIATALSDPNVEIASVNICGYASPEGSYISNERLATDRSKSLALHIAERYKLPAEATHYNAVAENWQGFRKAVEESKEINEGVKSTLLALIDREAYGPADYDAKEQELKTSPALASLYHSKILPDWFSKLRMTRFTISTQLKPMPDEELAKVILTTPEKLSLNQMFRVARLYPEGSEDFNRVISTALQYYPEDSTANLNAAVAALRVNDIDAAAKLLERAGNTPEALNARGVLATQQGQFESARDFFKAASPLPEALRNIELLGE